MQKELYQYKQKWFNFLGYKPHEGQLKLHYPEKDARFFVFVCGRRFGKPWASAMEATVVASKPNKRIWVVGTSYKKARLIFREIWKNMVLGKEDDVEKSSEKDMYIRFKWGTTVEGMSADNPSSLVGEGLDFLIIDEASKISPKIWDMYLSPTVAGRKGKVIFITTPQGYDWVYNLYALGKDDKDWYSTQLPSWINQHEFPDGKYDKAILERKRNMSPELFDQEFAAQFTSLSGRVYPFRDEDVGDFPYDPKLPTYCSIDFGYRMPAVLWLQTYTEGGIEHIRVIDEIIHEKDISTDKLISMVLKKGYTPDAYYGDPAGGFVQGQTGMGDIELFRRNGIRVQYKRDKVSRSISSSVTYVRGFFESADGLRRVHVNKDCVGIIEDFSNYRFPEALDGRQLKNEPVKDGYNEHGNDAFRYFITNRFPMKNQKLQRIKR